MRPDAARADRAAAVRAAARAWRHAGAIDDGALAAIAAAYPDDRRRMGPVFRVLVFLFAVLSINGAAGFVVALMGTHAAGGILAALSLLFGIALAVMTEVLSGPLRWAQGGVEAATSFAGLGYLIGFAGWICFEPAGLKNDLAFAATLLAAALLLAGAAWRWGYPLYAAAAVAALLGSLAFLHGGRWLWIVLPLLAAPVLVRGSESDRLPPAHRASCTAALAVALAGLYAAVNLVAYDQGWIEAYDFGRRNGPGGLRVLFIAATAMVPLVYLILGLRSRRYLFLVLGAATGAASLVTLRYYVHLAPLWVLLTASGALLMVAVFALRRYLDSGPGQERHGFTAEPLFEDPRRRRLLEAGAAILSLSPEAQPLHDEPKFTGGGGEFGGGGASGEF